MSQIFKPRPYQLYAIKQILQKPALALMLDMGLGKTVISLSAIKELKYNYLKVGKVLIIAPLRVAQSTWNDECEQWKHLRHFTISRVLGSEKERINALRTKAGAYIINKENVQWLVQLYGSRWPFDMVVIDESSSFKNSSSKRFRALKKVRGKIKRILLLTGTPAPNGLMDLWSQIWLLDRGIRLGPTITGYRNTYFTAGAGDGYVTYEWNARKGAEEQIYEKISDICISMKSEDYLTLPDVIYNKVKVKLPERIKAKYEKLEKEYVLELGNAELVATSAAALSGKLLQLANGSVYDEDKKVISVHDEKIHALEELLEINNGRTMMIFYWYKHDMVKLKKHFPYARELKSAEDIRAWNAGKIKLLLVHPASAGHGLNLQYGGNIVVWYGLTWSLELYQQANKRLHRSGQTKTVIIHHLVAEGTIDEQVMKALEDKSAGQSRMLEAVKARIRKYRN